MPILLQTTTPLLKWLVAVEFEFWILDFLNFFVCTWASWAEGEVEVVGHGHIGTFPQKGNSETSAEKRGSLLKDRINADHQQFAAEKLSYGS